MPRVLVETKDSYVIRCIIETIGEEVEFVEFSSWTREIATRNMSVLAVTSILESVDACVLDVRKDNPFANAVVDACVFLKTCMNKPVPLLVLISDLKNRLADGGDDDDDSKATASELSYVERVKKGGFTGTGSSKAFQLEHTALVHLSGSVCVIGCGELYGNGMERDSLFGDIFYDMFQRDICVTTAGSDINSDYIVPSLHVRDLAGIAREVLLKRAFSEYIFAFDNTQTVSSIAAALNNLFCCTESSSLANRQLRSDIQLWRGFRGSREFCEALGFAWHSADGLVVNIAEVAQELQQHCGLSPLRLCILGGPLSGKSSLSAFITRTYGIKLISVPQAIEEAMANTAADSDPIIQQVQTLMKEYEKKLAKAGKSSKSLASNSKSAKQQLPSSVNYNSVQDGRLPLELVVELLRRQMSSPLARLKGFVLDGFPRTKSEALALFPPLQSNERPSDVVVASDDKNIANQNESTAEQIGGFSNEEAEGEGKQQETTKPQLGEQDLSMIIKIITSEENAKQRCLLLGENAKAGHSDAFGTARRWSKFSVIDNSEATEDCRPESQLQKMFPESKQLLLTNNNNNNNNKGDGERKEETESAMWACKQQCINAINAFKQQPLPSLSKGEQDQGYPPRPPAEGEASAEVQQVNEELTRGKSILEAFAKLDNTERVFDILYSYLYA